MRLYTNCQNCKEEIRFSSREPDRVELSRSKGNELELTCRHCSETNLYHLNRIKATENKIALLIGLVIFFVGTPLTIFLIWDYLFRFTYIYVIAGLVGLIGIPFLIYSIIEKEQEKKVRLFNNYKISE